MGVEGADVAGLGPAVGGEDMRRLGGPLPIAQHHLRGRAPILRPPRPDREHVAGVVADTDFGRRHGGRPTVPCWDGERIDANNGEASVRP